MKEEEEDEDEEEDAGEEMKEKEGFTVKVEVDGWLVKFSCSL